MTDRDNALYYCKATTRMKTENNKLSNTDYDDDEDDDDDINVNTDWNPADFGLPECTRTNTSYSPKKLIGYWTKLKPIVKKYKNVITKLTLPDNIEHDREALMFETDGYVVSTWKRKMGLYPEIRQFMLVCMDLEQHGWFEQFGFIVEHQGKQVDPALVLELCWWWYFIPDEAKDKAKEYRQQQMRAKQEQLQAQVQVESNEVNTNADNAADEMVITDNKANLLNADELIENVLLPQQDTTSIQHDDIYTEMMKEVPVQEAQEAQDANKGIDYNIYDGTNDLVEQSLLLQQNETKNQDAEIIIEVMNDSIAHVADASANQNVYDYTIDKYDFNMNMIIAHDFNFNLNEQTIYKSLPQQNYMDYNVTTNVDYLQTPQQIEYPNIAVNMFSLQDSANELEYLCSQLFSHLPQDFMHLQSSILKLCDAVQFNKCADDYVESMVKMLKQECEKLSTEQAFILKKILSYILNRSGYNASTKWLDDYTDTRCVNDGFDKDFEVNFDVEVWLNYQAFLLTNNNNMHQDVKVTMSNQVVSTDLLQVGNLDVSSQNDDSNNTIYDSDDDDG